MDASRFFHHLWRYGVGITGLGMATIAIMVMPTGFQQISMALIYLLTILIIATTLGRGPAMFSVALAFLAINFFFAAPIHSLEVAAPQDALELGVFTIVAIISSELASQARIQAATAQRRSAELSTLYELSQVISAEVKLERILPIIAQTTTRLVDVPASSILSYEGGVLTECARAGENQPTQIAIDTPIQTQRQIHGILRIWLPLSQAELPIPQQSLLNTLASQIALVFERAHLASEVGHMRALQESEHLKSSLLLSVSHDFRTPLALIKGAVSNLLEGDVVWDGPTMQKFFLIIDEEADRLNRLVGNLLTMARIEAGQLHTTRSPQDIGEVVTDVVTHMERFLESHEIVQKLPADLPLVAANYGQLEQVMTNLLENAIRHTPPGTRIEIEASSSEEYVQLAVRDYGGGIPSDMKERLFQSFVRAAPPEQHANGTGLGLAICRSFITAQGGNIWVESPNDGGTRFVFTLPRAQAIS